MNKITNREELIEKIIGKIKLLNHEQRINVMNFIEKMEKEYGKRQESQQAR